MAASNKSEKSPSRGVAPPTRSRLTRAEQRDVERAAKLALLVALEIRRMVEDVLFRKGLLLEVWSRMRARKPLLNILRSRYDEVHAGDLLTLPVQVILGVEAFYRVVDEFRLYLETTEDMPSTLENTYANYAAQMEMVGLTALHLLQDLHKQNLNLGAQGGVKGGELLEMGGFVAED